MKCCFLTSYLHLALLCFCWANDDVIWPPEGVSLDDEPTIWPGHLKGLGSGFPSRKVYDYGGFPSVESFFGEHVVPKIPLLMKGAFTSAVLSKTSDEVLASIAHTFTTFVDVRNSKDETVHRMSLRTFLKSYRKEGLYLEIPIPPIMKSQFPLPRALQCDEVTDLFTGTRLEFRAEDWSTPLGTNGRNEIQCLLDGEATVLMINYINFPKWSEVLDLENGTKSGVDIEKVDFAKYPALRKVPLYHTVDVKSGDCLFVPSKWLYHMKMTGDRPVFAAIAWQSKTVLPTQKSCGVADDKNLAQATFVDDKEDNLFDLFTMNTLANFIGGYVNFSKTKNFSMEKFEKKLEQDKNLLKNIVWNEECREIARELFASTDTDDDGILSVDDLDSLTEEEMQYLGGKLEDRIADFRDIMDDQEEENKPKGIMGMAKTLNQDYEKELHKILEDGFNEILKESNIPGQVVFSNEGEPIIKMDSGAEIKTKEKETTEQTKDDNLEEILAENDEEMAKLEEFRMKMETSTKSPTLNQNSQTKSGKDEL